MTQALHVVQKGTAEKMSLRRLQKLAVKDIPVVVDSVSPAGSRQSYLHRSPTGSELWLAGMCDMGLVLLRVPV